MRCLKCGNEIADNAKFCGKCGNKVLAETQEFSSKEHVASENQNSEKQGMKPKKIIGIVAILIIAGISALLSGIFKIKNMERIEAIISCGIEGSNTKVYEYNGKLKELNMSAKYNKVDYIGEERFVVEENEKRLIDINDKLIKSLNYQDVYYFKEGLARVEADGKYGYIDKEGKEVLSPKYKDAYDFSEGLAVVRADGKYGYIDKEGKEVVSPKYGDVYNFREGLAVVEADGKWGYIDKEGKEVVSPKYEDAGDFSEGLAVVEADGKRGYIDKEGKEVLSPKYELAWGFSEGLARVEADGKYGYIDKEGKEVLSPKYVYAKDFRGGLARVKADGKYGYIDKEGKEVISPKYEGSWYFGKNTERLMVSFGNRNVDKYEYEGEFSDGLIVVIKDGKAGVINQEGEVIIPTIYDYIYITRR